MESLLKIDKWLSNISEVHRILYEKKNTDTIHMISEWKDLHFPTHCIT